MSLEVALQENTKALLALAAAYNSAGSPKAATPLPVAAPKATPAPTQPKAPAATPATTAPAALTYDKDVKPHALKLVAKNKQAYLDLLKEFGVEGGPALKAEQLPEFLKKLQAALGA